MKKIFVIYSMLLLSGCVSERGDWACVPVYVEDVFVATCQHVLI